MVTLLTLNKKEITEMADTMSDAFLFHENFKYLIPKQNRRKRALKNLFKMMYRVINRFGYIFVIEENKDKVGYITFMDENKYQMNLKTVIQTNGVHLFIYFMFHAGFRSLLKFNKYMKMYNQFEHKSEGVIHLFSTGIKKEYRGKRLMSEPFKYSFDYFKDLGYSIIRLETSDTSNLPIYNKLGFKCVKEIKSETDNQSLYFFDYQL